MRKQTQTDATGLLDWAVGTTPEKEWTQRVGALCLLPELLNEFSLDHESILAKNGLSAASLGHPDSRISYAAAGQLLATSAHATGCPHVGLLVGRAWTLEHMGLVGQLMRHSATLGDALRTLAVYHRLESEGATVYLSENKEAAVLGYAVLQPHAGGIEQLYDTALACGINLIRELLGEHSTLLKVVFARPQPLEPQPYRDLFCARLRFDSDHSALYLPKRLLDLPVPGANPKVRRQLEAQVDAAAGTDLVVRLHRALRVLLLNGETSGDSVAQQLAMHRRTLHRRLTAQGTTFQQVLDDVRWNLSRQLLGHTTLTLDKVASATGYADTSTFVRAFHRWSGTTPAKWREAQGRPTSSGNPADAFPGTR
jgi:AraC-like DNA-binding protein